MYYRSARMRAIFIVFCLLVLSAVSYAADSPKNIIFMIGDGMGIGHITAARAAGPGSGGKLTIDTLPITGLAKTYSANSLVTDSAAAGTALATGAKTNNGVISMTPDGKRVVSILEIAQTMGKSGGVISTKFITDATPAVFVSHTQSRKNRTEIAAQMIASGANVILGGGRKDFTPKKSGGSREDDSDMVAAAKERGYEFVDSLAAMNASKSNKLLGLFADDNMTTERPEPTIAEMTSKALSILAKNPKGFFVMSEGAQIDSYAHSNKIDGVVRQTLMFDEAVKVALDFAKKRGDTLVIVTADHETGGLAVHEPENDDNKMKARWTSGGHSGNMVAIYAYGPGSELFSGTHENTDIPRLMARLWGKKLN